MSSLVGKMPQLAGKGVERTRPAIIDRAKDVSLVSSRPCQPGENGREAPHPPRSRLSSIIRSKRRPDAGRL
jgi:hypothetical protein